MFYTVKDEIAVLVLPKPVIERTTLNRGVGRDRKRTSTVYFLCR